VTADRPPRCRPLPSHVVEAVASRADELSPPELLDRLDQALAALPPAERAAVVAAHGYAEGPVGAAIELDAEIADADLLARSGLELLRAALADVEPGT
jgi:DNA-directed RNA polymerase specialized sigma24 family protein